MNVAIATVAAGNYVSFARVFAASARRHHPDIPVLLALSDKPGGRLDPAGEHFEVVDLSELPISELDAFLFRHSRRQASIAVKPFLLQYALDSGFDAVVYIDADVLVVGEVTNLLEASSSNAITLVPHLLEPLEGGDRLSRELNILQSGAFNGGVVGVRDTGEGRRFLAWWQDRVSRDCRHAVAEGLHYDQRWLDLVPAYFEDVHVFREPGVNVAHWNLPERDASDWRLFHFSGFQPHHPEALTQYSDRLPVGTATQLVPLYLRALLDAGWNETRRWWEYAYGRFDNGVRIPAVVRAVYGDLGGDAARFGNPFRTAGTGSFFHWLTGPAGGNGGVSQLWHGVHAQRPDLQVAFPDPLGADEDAFGAWVVKAGAAEHAVPAELM